MTFSSAEVYFFGLRPLIKNNHWVSRSVTVIGSHDDKFSLNELVRACRISNLSEFLIELVRACRISNLSEFLIELVRPCRISNLSEFLIELVRKCRISNLSEFLIELVGECRISNLSEFLIDHTAGRHFLSQYLDK